MSRNIHCSECKTHLGEIRDGKLKKGISYLCSKCESARKLNKVVRQTKKRDNIDNIFSDILGDII